MFYMAINFSFGVKNNFAAILKESSPQPGLSKKSDIGFIIK